jgi:hypothetical protein
LKPIYKISAASHNLIIIDKPTPFSSRTEQLDTLTSHNAENPLQRDLLRREDDARSKTQSPPTAN